ncbi:MAG TPA: hypothetical protein VL400_25590, partial [Polyangiaceae bacterium]|nr:hypothetical protein [Polyangiaceae bacterium]
VHYQANEFPAALALLRLLGEDRDALSPTEQAEFAYLRGMTDLRIASTLPDTRAGERASFRGCARDWLGIAVAPNASARSPGGTATAPPLTPDELGRAREALADLAQIEDAPGGITPPGACIEP